MLRLLLFFIIFYQKCISPHFVARCKYSPSCSQYAYEALKIHGLFVGFMLAIYRLLRCNPFSKGGYDPVPPIGFINKIW